ncbi:LysR substrate-binding domain-containing protein [Actinoallomurus purpureus]|uniref:LysR family transcriptional regulator n=1 Tax=Actinoallomurus purpureus TaxID=478114 RepID=UPI002093F8D7|nr:LysR substrate-binding domain-containing protein [Actinoallomurus purpureus]MCO6005438.1 LysR substrate-binding domain-containing protein [Actinoallomurus purpureus]
MELRQLRYFVILAEELHFGRAAQRHHIGQSALSQQLRLLERELGVRLLDRSTHHVQLTCCGKAFLTEARKILSQVERAVALARSERERPTLRVGILDPSYDSMPLVLNELQERYPDLKIQQVRASLSQQYQWLSDGRLDVGFGRAFLTPPEIASKVFRLDRLGVLLSAHHRFASLEAVPVKMLAGERVMMHDDDQAPEFNQLFTELCRSADVVPTPYPGSSDHVHGTLLPVSRRRCVFCVPASGAPLSPQVVWRRLIEPDAVYPWSVLWRSDDESSHVRAVVECALQLARERGWLRDTAGVERPQHVYAQIGV